MRTYKINQTPFVGLYNEIVEEVGKDGKKVLRQTGEMYSEKNPDGTVKELPVDQFSGKSFMLNACGHPMNDIMAFETSQSDDIARQVLQRLQVYPVQNDGLGNDLEARFAQIVPENWSSPAEFVRMQRKFTELAYKEQERQAVDKRSQKKNSKEETIDFTNDNLSE